MPAGRADVPGGAVRPGTQDDKTQDARRRMGPNDKTWPLSRILTERVATNGDNQITIAVSSWKNGAKYCRPIAANLGHYLM